MSERLTTEQPASFEYGDGLWAFRINDEMGFLVALALEHDDAEEIVRRWEAAAPAPEGRTEERAVIEAARVVVAVAPAYYGAGMLDYVTPPWVPQPMSLALAIDKLSAALGDGALPPDTTKEKYDAL